MRGTKICLTLLLGILILVGVCGCMENGKQFETPILEYLQDKYGSEFVMLSSGLEFNGTDGTYIHATCKSESYDETIHVYCYPESKRKGDQLDIGGVAHVVEEDYAEIVFQNELQEKLQALAGEDVFLRCQVSFSNHCISKDEFEAGLKACLENGELYSHVTVYTIAGEAADMTGIRSAIEAFCGGFDAYRQYLYFASTPDDTDMQKIQTHYTEEPNTYDVHLNECEEIARVEFTLLKRGEGVTKRSVERE